MDLRKFFKGKRILITGHTGFKGAWLTQIMINFGAKVCGYSLTPNTNPNLFQVLKLSEKIDNNFADIRNLNKFDEVLKQFKPDIVFHLAAQPIVRDSYDDPVYTYETNVMGTVNVLESMRLNQVPAGVIITTDKVYHNFEKDIAYQENDKLCGYDPYSNSKACADLAVGSYINSFFNPKDYKITHRTLIASARAGNVIGGGDWAKDRLIPDAVKAFLEEKKDLIIRSPKAIRPWQYVLEPLYGYILLSAHLFIGETDKSGAWNFGPEKKDMQTVDKVLKALIKSIKCGNYVIEEDKSKHEANLLKLNNTKAKTVLNWYPKYDLGKAVSETASWYKSYYVDKLNMGEFTITQIENYFNLK